MKWLRQCRSRDISFRYFIKDCLNSLKERGGEYLIVNKKVSSWDFINLGLICPSLLLFSILKSPLPPQIKHSPIYYFPLHICCTHIHTCTHTQVKTTWIDNNAPQEAQTNKLSVSRTRNILSNGLSLLKQFCLLK